MGSKVGQAIIPLAASLLAPGIGTALGLGGGFLGTAAGGALAGGLGSALTGGKVFKDALTGGLSAGAGNLLGQAGSSVFGGDGNLFGTPAGTPLGNGLQGPTQGTGLTGAVSRGTSDIANSLSNLTSGTGLSTGGGASSFAGSAGGSSGGSGSSLFDSLFGSGSTPSSGLASSTGGSPINWNPAGGMASAAPTTTSGLGGNILGSQGGSGMKLGDLLGGINSYTAQDKIAQQQKDAFAQAQGYLNPYYQSGTAANKQLGDLLGTNGASAGQTAQQALMNNPGYQFRLGQGEDLINKQLAAQGLSGSGSAIKAAQDYAQNSASDEYQNAIRNLMGQSGAGQNAAAGLGGYSNLAGQAGAAATGQQSNIINQALGGLFGTSKTPLDQLLQQFQSRTRSSYA